MSSIVCNCTIADAYILELYWPNTVSFLCLCCLDINRWLQISFGDLVALVPATRALNNVHNFLSLTELIFDDFMSLLLNYSLEYSTCGLVKQIIQSHYIFSGKNRNKTTLGFLIQYSCSFKYIYAAVLRIKNEDVKFVQI